MLLNGYSEAARAFDSWMCEDANEIKKLQLEVLMLYKACYDRAKSKGETGGRGLAFAWNVAGDYLCEMKARAIHRRKHGGVPMKAVDTERLVDAVGAGRRRALGADADDAEHDDDEDDEHGGE
jgi:hypothetical protein